MVMNMMMVNKVLLRNVNSRRWWVDGCNSGLKDESYLCELFRGEHFVGNHTISAYNDEDSDLIQYRHVYGGLVVSIRFDSWFVCGGVMNET